MPFGFTRCTLNDEDEKASLLHGANCTWPLEFDFYLLLQKKQGHLHLVTCSLHHLALKPTHTNATFGTIFRTRVRCVTEPKKFMKCLREAPGPGAWETAGSASWAFVICSKIFGHIVNCCSLEGRQVPEETLHTRKTLGNTQRLMCLGSFLLCSAKSLKKQ